MICPSKHIALAAVWAAEAWPSDAQPIVAQPDSVELSTTLDEVEVEATVRGNQLSGSAVMATENISRVGLTKMACCTVAESFENSAAVSVDYSDAVSGARQIKLLGLAGTYTQLLDESRPMMRGLAAPFALDYTPGEWLRSIQVAKGVSSVSSGHEAITGQINLEYRRPTDDERLHLNVYLNDMLRPEVNLTSAIPLTADKRLSTIVMVHGSLDTDWREMRAMDRNRDGFRDLPSLRQVDVANRWLWLGPGGLQLRWGARFTADNRTGGQLDYRHNQAEHEASMAKPASTVEPISALPALYGSHVDNREASAYVKAALPVGAPIGGDAGDQVQNNVALVADFAHFESRSYFGLNDYHGRDNTASLTLRYDHHFGTSASLAVGLQGRLSNIAEYLVQKCVREADASTINWLWAEHNLDRREREVGAFAEWTQHIGGRLTLVAGVREDYNSHCRRWSFTPRGHVKWSITPRTTLRLSGGTGYRMPNAIGDNLAMLAIGRPLAFELQGNILERAVAFGGSFAQTFALGRDPNASVSVDYFRTRFARMTYADQETWADRVVVGSNTWLNYTDTWQVDANWTPVPRLDVLATFRYTNSRVTLPEQVVEGVGGQWHPGSGRVERPLVGRYKGVLNVQYATKFRRWVFDVTAQLNGPMRLPTISNQAHGGEHSPAYGMLFAQVTHKVSRGEVYAGCENITDYRQRDVIDSAEAPFSQRFNASRVWGPVMGRRFYVGFRWNIY